MTESIYFVVTFIVDVFAILLSIIFYLSAKRAESEASKLSTELNAQVGNLGRLTSRWVDRSFDFLAQRPSISEDSFTKFSQLLSQSSFLETLQISRPKDGAGAGELRTYLETALIHIFCANAQINYFAQGYLPPFETFDEHNVLHNFYKLHVDSSHSTFGTAKKFLCQADPVVLANNPAFLYYEDTRKYWEPYVKTTEEIFLARRNSKS